MSTMFYFFTIKSSEESELASLESYLMAIIQIRDSRFNVTKRLLGISLL